MKALLYTPDGAMSEVEITCFTDCQDLLGGLVEIQDWKLFGSPYGNYHFLVNEEGNLLNLPTNKSFKQFKGSVLLCDLELLKQLPFTHED